MDKQISEIDKLTIRISKDPKSKLFVPLAEEYRKEGDIEMAIHVLSEGIKNNPTYVTARSVLGKLLLEKGDLLGSQKEFEEVVKAIPDNLMAQRKLGDIYVLQNRPDDALNHYRTVLAANPRDKELASLVSDLEAGHAGGVKPLQQKVKAAPEKKTQQESPAAAMPKTAPPLPGTPLAAPSDQPGDVTDGGLPSSTSIPSVNAPMAAAVETTFAESAPSDLLSAMETEEPEEVLFVEPLETIASPERSAFAAGVPFPAEEMPSHAVPAVEENTEIPSVESDLFKEEPAVAEEPGAGAEPSAIPMADDSVFSETMPEFDESSTEPGIVEAELVADAPGAIPDQAHEEELPSSLVSDESAIETPEEPSGKSDDFTTDTLAELYIAQGFYEKAIDIYQRMVADKPTSRGLQDKLERVRAMAAQSSTNAEEGTPVAGSEIPEAAPNLVSEAEDAVAGVSAGQAAAGQPFSEEPLFAEAEEFGIGAASLENAVVEADTILEPTEFWTGEESDAGKPVEQKKDNEAREYVPPAEDEEIVIDAELFTPAEEKEGDSLFTEAREYQPPVDTEGEVASPEGMPGFDVFASPPVQDHVAEKPLFADFEAREYVPPKTEAGPREPKAEKIAAAPEHIKADKKETIDRLESWLRTIKKES